MSFSQDTKNSISSENIKNKCCKRALLYGMLMFSGVFNKTRIKLVTENEKSAELFKGLLMSLTGIETNTYISPRKSGDEVVNSYKMTVAARASALAVYDYFGSDNENVNNELFECSTCRMCFARGAFLAAGTVSDPGKSYHVDIRSSTLQSAELLSAILAENGINAKLGERSGKITVYIKDSDNIQDFLTYVGAQKSALDFIDKKIVRELRNTTNRLNNFETANMFRSIGSSEVQVKAIEKLKKNGRFDLLPEDLRTTAIIRLENPFASLVDIANLHNPPITKSGVNHRLKKLEMIANESYESEEETDSEA